MGTPKPTAAYAIYRGKIERAEIKHFSEKRVTLARSSMGFGYRTRFRPDQLAYSKEEAVESKRVDLQGQILSAKWEIESAEKELSALDEL